MAMSIDHIPFHVKRNWLTGDEKSCRGEFNISRSKLNEFHKDGPAWKYFNAEIVEEVIGNPCSLFFGLKRPNFDQAYCYCGRCDHRYNSKGKAVEWPHDRLLAAFVKWQEGLVVFDWDFRESDPDDENLPSHWGDDFGGKIWSMTPSQQDPVR